MKKTIETKTNADTISAAQAVADTAANHYLESKDIKSAQAAIAGYSAAVRAGVAQLSYNRATGKAVPIPFFE